MSVRTVMTGPGAGILAAAALLSAASVAWSYEVPEDFEDALLADHTPQTMASLWTAETAGTNLALGKQATYMPRPDWSYCVDAGDPGQLTDGVILFTTHEGLSDIQIWNKLRVSAQAVGWHDLDTPVHILIDLQGLYAVRRVVVRYQGGMPGVFDFPHRMRVVVSEDGQNFYGVGQYLNEPGPREGPFACYRMPYLGDYAVIFPYVFGELTTKARYVGIEVSRRGSAFLDEIAVLQGDFDPAGVQYDELDRCCFPTTGAAILPRDGVLYVPRNVTLFEHVAAFNDLAGEGTDVSWVVELPAGVSLSDAVHLKEPKPDFRTAPDELYPPFYDQVSPITRGELAYTRYVFKYAGPHDSGPKGGKTHRLGPLFFETARPPGAAGVAYVYAQWAGGQQSPLAVPVRVYTMPAASVPRRLHVSFGWMPDFCSTVWPDYLNQYRKLGFNVHPTFPRYWDRGIAGYDGSEALVASARSAGYSIVYNESPLNASFRPAQRDAAYQTMLQNLHDRAGRTNPDWVFHDVEHLSPNDPDDPEFVARMVAEGLDPEDPADQQEMLLRLGTEIYGDMYDAVVGGMTDAGYEAGPAAGRPLCGSFQFYAGTGILYWFEYARLYPGFLQYSMPAYYNAGDAEFTGRSLSGVRQAQGSSDIIPWLSPGCYGEFDSARMRDQALESFLGGCRGITYYSSRYVDGQDFYYHLEAVNIAARIEDVITDGTVITADRLACVGQRLSVKGLELPGGEAAILVSRYGQPKNVPIPALQAPGPGLRVPFTTDLSPETYGHMDFSSGTWTVAGGVGTAADTGARASYTTTADDGTETLMPTDRDWVARFVYREDQDSRQQFLRLSPNLCEVYCRQSTQRLLLTPGNLLLEVLKTPDGWHTLTFHYKSATSGIDIYVDEFLRMKDYQTAGNYALEYVELTGPLSLAHIEIGGLDAQAGQCQGGSAETCVQVRYEPVGPSDVVDLDTATFVGSISPESPIFEARMDRTTKVFHVRPPVPADFDRDADVDGLDGAAFVSCLSGPSVPHNGTVACRQADFDGDGDVDLSDFGRLQRCASGPGVLADFRCAE